MKEYNEEEVDKILEKLNACSDDIERQINSIRTIKSSTKLIEFSKRKELEREIKQLFEEINYLNMAKLLFLIYSDKFTQEPKTHISDEKWLKIENEAALGDGISKMLLFHHKCFVEKTITTRDFLRLKADSHDGNSVSAYILMWFKEYFDDGLSK